MPLTSDGSDRFRRDPDPDDIRPTLPTWVEIIADLRADLNVLCARVAQLERERKT